MQMVAVMVSWLLVLFPAAATKSAVSMAIHASGSTTIGLQVFANINLSGTNPTGWLTFRLYGPGDTGCARPVFTSTVAVTGVSTNSAHYTTAHAGTFRWTASYGGDANNNPAGPTACSDPNAAVIVGGAHTGLSATAPPPVNGILRGAAALVGGVNPTGAVTLYLSPPGDTFCSQTVFTSTVAVAGNGSYSSGPYQPTVTGTYRWRASYSGDSDNMADPITSCLDPSDAVNVTSVAPALGLLTYPTDGQTGADTTRAFTWAPTPLGQSYYLLVGTTRYGYDLVNSGVLPAGQDSLAVPALPAGPTLYATLLTETGGSWSRYQAITFTAAPGLATFTSPLNGQSKVARSPVFAWSTIPQAQAYVLVVGTTHFGSDVVNSGILAPTRSSYTSAVLPAGRVLYATLLTETNGSWTRYQAIIFST